MVAILEVWSDLPFLVGWTPRKSGLCEDYCTIPTRGLLPSLTEADHDWLGEQVRAQTQPPRQAREQLRDVSGQVVSVQRLKRL